jgi:uncharacterized YccA/Bax inhibitor family protein
LDEAIVESRYAAKRPLTLNGTVNKTAALLALCAASAAATWVQLLTGGPAAFGAVLGATKVAGIVAMVSALASMFKPLWSGVTGPVYALAKGVALAGVSAYAELMVPGIALNTVLLTLCTAGSLLFGLRSGLIRVRARRTGGVDTGTAGGEQCAAEFCGGTLSALRMRLTPFPAPVSLQVTDQFGDAVRAATGGFFISMLAVLVMGMFGIRFPSLLTSGAAGIQGRLGARRVTDLLQADCLCSMLCVRPLRPSTTHAVCSSSLPSVAGTCRAPRHWREPRLCRAGGGKPAAGF